MCLLFFLCLEEVVRIFFSPIIHKNLTPFNPATLPRLPLPPFSFVISTADVNCSNNGKNLPNVVNVMYNRMIEFVEQYNILYRCQFGFRKNYSTSHVLTHLINRISSAIDPRETTVGVFLDLSKAFDTLDHEILFTKLEHYGIRDVAKNVEKKLLFLIKLVPQCGPLSVEFLKDPS